jgi:type II secretory pathway component PulK
MISNPRISCKRWPKRPGVAVVVTVLLISLLSLMILAFLMIASNSRLSVAAETGRRQADQLVRQAAALSAGEIKAMMAAGSNQTLQVDARQKVMRVTDSAAMLPARRPQGSSP